MADKPLPAPVEDIKWRVWWIPQLGARIPTFVYDCPSLEAAKVLDGALGKYDQYQLEHNIKPDFSNAGGVQWMHPLITEGEWWDYEEEDFLAAVAEWRERQPQAEPAQVLWRSFLVSTGWHPGESRFWFRLPAHCEGAARLNTSGWADELLRALQHWQSLIRSASGTATLAAKQIEKSLITSIERSMRDNIQPGEAHDYSDVAILWLSWEIIQGRGEQHVVKDDRGT